MPEALEKARRVIKERLHELDGEAKRLRDALTHLGSTDGGRPTKRPARRRARRAPRGQRQRQLLASVEKYPEYKPSEHAKAIKVNPNQVYALAGRLQDEGRISKTAKGTYRIKKARATTKAS